MPSLKTVSQLRAAFAWEQIANISQSDVGKYRDMAQKFPSMVQTNGFGQAIAFLIDGSRSDRGKAELVKHLALWLCARMTSPIYTSPAQGAPNADWLLRQLIHGDARKLQRATVETQALAVWLKRFSKSEENRQNLPPAAADAPPETPAAPSEEQPNA